MRNFNLIATGVNTAPVLSFLLRRPDLWGQNTLRQTFLGSPHTAVLDIWGRFQPITSNRVEDYLDQHECINYPAFHQIDGLKPLVFDLMRAVQGERLGRVLLTKLPPNCSIPWHKDEGDHSRYYDRYHIGIAGHAHSFHVKDAVGRVEAVCIQPGEVYWFQNALEHSVVNNGAPGDDRITLIVDIKTSHE